MFLPGVALVFEYTFIRDGQIQQRCKMLIVWSTLRRTNIVFYVLCSCCMRFICVIIVHVTCVLFCCPLCILVHKFNCVYYTISSILTIFVYKPSPKVSPLTVRYYDVEFSRFRHNLGVRKPVVDWNVTILFLQSSRTMWEAFCSTMFVSLGCAVVFDVAMCSSSGAKHASCSNSFFLQ